MILITGASGFIGKHLLNALVKTYGKDQVVALTSKAISECKYIYHRNYTFSQDIFEREGLTDSITTLIHAGAFTPKNAEQADDWEKSNENIFNTQLLLKAKLPKLQKVIYLSTLDVYGEASLITEDTVLNPASLYGHSKLYCERVISYWAKTRNISSQILRIGHVYGPGEEAYQKLIPLTMKKLINNEVIEVWGKGSDLRAFIFIDDVVRAILKAITLQADIGPVNIVSRNSMTIKEVIEHIIKVSGKESIINMISAPTSPKNFVFDNSKMRKFLLSDEYSFEDGLSREWNNLLNLK